jgi:hypothetical protein
MHERGSTPDLGRGFSFVLIVGLAFLLASNELADYDAWWHIRTGQLIPERGWPSTDWYSFSSSDRPWVDVHWGFQLLVAGVYSVGGIAGLVVMQASVVAMTLAVMHLSCRASTPPWLAWSILFVSLVAMSGRFNVRPELLSMLFLAVDLAILLRAPERAGLIWWMVPIQVVWANVQSLYVFGPILMLLFLLEGLVGGPAARVGMGRLLSVSALMLLACVLSPYGITNVLFLLDVFSKIDPNAGQIYRETIGELVPLPTLLAQGGSRAGYVAATLWLAGAVLLGVVLSLREMISQRRVFCVLSLVAFGFIAWQSVRNVGHFAIVAGMWSIVLWSPKVPTLREWRLPWVGMGLATMIVGFAWMGGTWSRWVLSDREFGFGPHPAHFSFEAMEVCAKPGMPTRAAIFHLGHAATYIFRCGPERQVLMDPRLEVNSEETYRRYRELQALLEQGAPEGMAMLDRLQVPLVVADSQNNLGIQATLLASPLWRCVHWDPVVAVFVRTTYPLPADVGSFDFLAGIFDDSGVTDLYFAECWGIRVDVRPSGSDRREPVRLIYLAQALMARPEVAKDLVEQVIWRAIRLSALEMNDRRATRARRGSGYSEYHEQRRAMTCALLLLDQWTSVTSPEKEFPTAINWLGGHGRSWGRKLLEVIPGEMMISLMLAESLAEAGGIDESIAVLENIQFRSSMNRARQTLREEVDRSIAQKRRQLEGRSQDGLHVEPTVASFDMYRRAGRAGEFARAMRDMVDEEMNRWPATDRIDLSRAIWRFDPSVSLNVHLGEYEMGSSHLEGIAKMSDDPAVAARQSIMNVAFAAVTADRTGLRRAIDEASMADLSETDRRWLEHIRELFLHEANPR